ncbi:MAG: restriction endonuclease HindIII [Ignavibacteria bacterium]|nr:restriction endonuclease HindIII [Ignavibacteria bacterium]
MRQQIIDLIFEIAKEKNAFDLLEKQISKISKNQLSENIIMCGILPEMFEHDSSEEKLWAKFTDIILAQSLTHIGIPSEVLRTRGDSADVFGKNNSYSIIGDAKTFRLSRTSKNQKDFKIKALDDWRKDNNFALLVGPLTQFPNRKSQIYFQSIDKNVTLLSYTHLNYLLTFYKNQALQPLWETGLKIKKHSKSINHQSAENYWEEIDSVLCSIFNRNYNDLKKFKLKEIEKTKEIGNEGITYWKEKIESFNKLSKKEAISILIKAGKIETKIKTIQKAIEIEISY